MEKRCRYTVPARTVTKRPWLYPWTVVIARWSLWDQRRIQKRENLATISYSVSLKTLAPSMKKYTREMLGNILNCSPRRLSGSATRCALSWPNVWISHCMVYCITVAGHSHILLLGQNVSEQNGTDKMIYGQKGIRTKWYWTKWYWTKWHVQNGTDKMVRINYYG